MDTTNTIPPTSSPQSAQSSNSDSRVLDLETQLASMKSLYDSHQVILTGALQALSGALEGHSVSSASPAPLSSLSTPSPNSSAPPTASNPHLMPPPPSVYRLPKDQLLTGNAFSIATVFHMHAVRVSACDSASKATLASIRLPGNVRKAMRVLEDHLCVELLGDVKKASLCHSLRDLDESGLHKEAFDAMMTKHGLTKQHLVVMRSLKKNGSLEARHGWGDLAQHAISLDDDADTVKLKADLFELMLTFSSGYGMRFSASPFFDNANDFKFKSTF